MNDRNDFSDFLKKMQERTDPDKIKKENIITDWMTLCSRAMTKTIKDLPPELGERVFGIHTARVGAYNASNWHKVLKEVIAYLKDGEDKNNLIEIEKLYHKLPQMD